MKTAKEILDKHCMIGDKGLELAIINAMEEYAITKSLVIINGEDIKAVLDKNCSEFDDNIIQ